MKKLIAVFCLSLIASCATFVQNSPHASADSICFNAAAPTPTPIPGHPTLGICNNNILQVNATITGAPATPVPFPTSATGVLLVQPTNVPTIGVNCVSGCSAAAYPTTAAGFLIVAPTALPTQTIQGCVGCVAVPVSISNTPLPAQVNACNVGFTACSNVGTTVADGYSDLLESLFSTGFGYSFNGASWDRTRNAGVGNTVPSTGLQIGAAYGEFLTALPTLTTGTYGSLQLDSSGRLIISPTGLPTPVPVPTSASLYPKTVQCDPTTGTSCALVSASGVTDTAVCTTGAVCAVVGAPADATVNAQNTLYGFSLGGLYNGTTWDRARSATVGNTVAATGLGADAAYCEFLTALPTLTTGTYGAGQCDSNGRRIVVGAGVAGTPAGGVASVQGVAGGTALPVSGTVALGAGAAAIGSVTVSATDPCLGTAKSSAALFVSGNAQVITFSGATSTYICGLSLNYEATAGGLSQIVYGTGTTCAVVGGTLYNFQTSTAAVGMSTLAYGGSGAQILNTVPASSNVCVLTGGTGAMITGVITYIQK